MFLTNQTHISASLADTQSKTAMRAYSTTLVFSGIVFLI